MKFLSEANANNLLSKVKGYIDSKLSNNPVPDVTIPPFIRVDNFSFYQLSEPDENGIATLILGIIRLDYLLPVGATIVSAGFRYVKKDGYSLGGLTTALRYTNRILKNEELWQPHQRLPVVTQLLI